MNIEVKKLKTFIGNEGYGFNAEVWVDGVRTCFVIDDASGSIFYDYTVYDKPSFKKLEDYVASLPAEQLTEHDGKPYLKDGKPVMLPASMESVIEDAIKKFELAKGLKKLEKKFVNHIIWGNKTFNGQYTYYKFRQPLSQYPTDWLQTAVNKYKAQLKDDEQFYNTNFEALKIKV